MNYNEFRQMYKEAKAIPLPRRVWKWLRAGKRGIELQAKMHANQLKKLNDVSVDDLARQFNLPHKPLVDLLDDSPESAQQMIKYWRSYPNNNIVTNEPFSQLEAILGMPQYFHHNSDMVKPTDTMKHELGHIASKERGMFPAGVFIRRTPEKASTIIKRLLQPETSEMSRLERAADEIAFGDNGKLSKFKQLRHHPAYTSYLSGTRIAAGVQGAAVAANTYSGYRAGKWLYNKAKGKQPDNSPESAVNGSDKPEPRKPSKLQAIGKQEASDTDSKAFHMNGKALATGAGVGGATALGTYGLAGLVPGLKKHKGLRLLISALSGTAAGAYAAKHVDNKAKAGD